MSRQISADPWLVQNQVLASMSSDPATRMSIHIHRELAEAADAQWTLARVQEESNEIAERQNSLLASLSGDLSRSFSKLNRQLGAATEHLARIRDTQEEHLDILKRERKLKEVLFQLNSLVERLTEAGDGISLLAACEHCLATLESNRLGTADLNDFIDKKMFSDFVEHLHTTTRELGAVHGEDLAAFRASYVLFHVCLREGFRHNHPPRRRLPTWGDAPGSTRIVDPAQGEGREAWHLPRWREPPKFNRREAPEWQKRNPPAWEPSEPPSLSSLLKTCPSSPDRPVEVANPGPPPLPLSPDMYPAGYLPPSAEKVPTQADTDARLPPSRTWSEWFRYPPEKKRAREYEDTLRKWQAAKQRYDECLSRIKRWEQACEKVSLATKEVVDVTFPRMLEEHGRQEEERRAAYESALKAFEVDEEKRLAEWRRSVEAFEEEERSRLESFAVLLKKFQAEEQERKSVFDAECAQIAESNSIRDVTVAREREQWQANRETHQLLLNDFLTLHSGLQEFYPQIVGPLVPEALQLPRWDFWQNGTQLSDGEIAQALFSPATDEECAVIKSFFDAKNATVDVLVEWGRQHPEFRSRVPNMLALLEQASHSHWHHDKFQSGGVYWQIRANLHAIAGTTGPREARDFYEEKFKKGETDWDGKLQCLLESHDKDPQFLWAANDYAWLMATSNDLTKRNGLAAVQYALHACKLSDWHCWSFIDTLAAAYAQCGEEDMAVACAKRALMLVPQEEKGYVERLITLYETGQPYPAEGV